MAFFRSSPDTYSRIRARGSEHTSVWTLLGLLPPGLTRSDSGPSTRPPFAAAMLLRSRRHLGR
jgi:hypothetical protein